MSVLRKSPAVHPSVPATVTRNIWGVRTPVPFRDIENGQSTKIDGGGRFLTRAGSENDSA